jgi:hypothetical protein
MTPLAANQHDARIELWWAALGAGLVVILCVVVLLTLLGAFVRDIERHLQAGSREAGHAASHVSDAHLIGAAAGLIDTLGTELASHVAVLSDEENDRR